MIGKTNEFYNERMLKRKIVQRGMLKRMNARTNDAATKHATTNEYYNE